MTRNGALAVVLVAASAAAILTGCGPKVVCRKQADLVGVNYGAVDCLMWKARQWVPGNARILCATFVDNDDLTQASTFGRVLGELCSSRLAQRGHTVANMKVRRNVVIRPRDGEFFLSRDWQELGQIHNAQYILVGTYTRTRVGESVRSLNRRYEAVDPTLAPHPADPVNPASRTIELVPDYVYVSLRLVNATDNTLVASHDYRIRCDENIEALIASGAAAAQTASR